eukprot:1160575-Pelagomonas_calceolata.AAC.2
MYTDVPGQDFKKQAMHTAVLMGNKLSQKIQCFSILPMSVSFLSVHSILIGTLTTAEAKLEQAGSQCIVCYGGFRTLNEPAKPRLISP